MGLTPENVIGHLVERMTDVPSVCMFCGKGNVADEDGNIGPFIATNIDRNWGDSCYICLDCGTTIGAMSGMGSPDDLKDLERALSVSNRRIHDLEAQLQIRTRRQESAESRLDAALTTKKELKRRAAKAAV